MEGKERVVEKSQEARGRKRSFSGFRIEKHAEAEHRCLNSNHLNFGCSR